MSEPAEITVANPSTAERIIDGQDDLGRFAKGNRHGRGNPVAIRMRKLQAILVKAATPEKMQQIADMLIGQTLAGSDPHARLLLKYILPAPEKTINLKTNKMTPEDVRNHIRAVFGLKADPPDAGRN